jgi:hypothetical protein
MLDKRVIGGDMDKLELVLISRNISAFIRRD